MSDGSVAAAGIADASPLARRYAVDAPPAASGWPRSRCCWCCRTCRDSTSNFGRSLLSQMGIAIVFALSYNLLLGQTGLLSFGHAVYFGLGGFAAIHFMRAINAGLPVPMPLVPLVGAATGLAFGLLFGAVTTRRAGVVFALISLGIGELVFAASRMLQGFSGGEEGITANRARGPHVFGLEFRLAAAGLLHHRVLGACRRGADVRLHAHAGGPHVQRRPGQSRARGVHRLQHAGRALHRLFRSPRCSRDSPAACTRSTTRSSPPMRSAPRARAACC